MNPETQALIDRIANGTTTAADAEKVKAFVEAYDKYIAEHNYWFEDVTDAVVNAREALK